MYSAIINNIFCLINWKYYKKNLILFFTVYSDKLDRNTKYYIFIVAKILLKCMLNYVVNSEAQLNIYIWNRKCNQFQPLFTQIYISNYISNLTVVNN